MSCSNVMRVAVKSVAAVPAGIAAGVPAGAASAKHRSTMILRSSPIPIWDRGALLLEYGFIRSNIRGNS